jgi:16S rRNA (adenine1518-N6/adenine1519-N6)-dimethyltransferase
LSLAVYPFYQVKEVMKLKPNSFSPPPKVDSTVLYYERRENPLMEFQENYFLFLQRIFINKRKMLFNNLKNKNNSEILKNIFKNVNISSKLRIEQLTKQQILNLYMEFKKYGLQIH